MWIGNADTDANGRSKAPMSKVWTAGTDVQGADIEMPVVLDGTVLMVAF